jgi:hypothetical protein
VSIPIGDIQCTAPRRGRYEPATNGSVEIVNVKRCLERRLKTGGSARGEERELLQRCAGNAH